MRDFVQQIFDVGPTAVPLMEQLNQESEALLSSVQDLQRNVEEKQSSLDSLQGQLQQQMASLKQKVAEKQQLVDQQTEETKAKTEELKAGLQEIQDGITDALETAQQVMDDFRGHIDTGRQLVESANEAAQSVLTDVNSAIDQGRQALHAATDFGNQQVDALQSKIDETFDFTENMASSLIAGVDEGLRATGAKIEEMTGISFGDLQSVFTSGMEMVQGNVIENGVNMALDQLQSMIQEQLNQAIDTLLEEMVSCLGNIRENLFGNAEEAGLERKLLEPILDQLDTILDPLFSAVDHLKGIAAMVGIDV
jgi:chaperonin cofactor prefoldin